VAEAWPAPRRHPEPRARPLPSGGSGRRGSDQPTRRSCRAARCGRPPRPASAARTRRDRRALLRGVLFRAARRRRARSPPPKPAARAAPDQQQRLQLLPAERRLLPDLRLEPFGELRVLVLGAKPAQQARLVKHLGAALLVERADRLDRHPQREACREDRRCSFRRRSRSSRQARTTRRSQAGLGGCFSISATTSIVMSPRIPRRRARAACEVLVCPNSPSASCQVPRSSVARSRESSERAAAR